MHVPTGYTSIDLHVDGVVTRRLSNGVVGDGCEGSGDAKRAWQDTVHRRLTTARISLSSGSQVLGHRMAPIDLDGLFFSCVFHVDRAVTGDNIQVAVKLIILFYFGFQKLVGVSKV